MLENSGAHAPREGLSSHEPTTLQSPKMSLLECGAAAPPCSAGLRGAVWAAIKKKNGIGGPYPSRFQPHSDDLDLFVSFLELEESWSCRFRTVSSFRFLPGSFPVPCLIAEATTSAAPKGDLSKEHGEAQQPTHVQREEGCSPTLAKMETSKIQNNRPPRLTFQERVVHKSTTTRKTRRKRPPQFVDPRTSARPGECQPSRLTNGFTQQPISCQKVKKFGFLDRKDTFFQRLSRSQLLQSVHTLACFVTPMFLEISLHLSSISFHTSFEDCLIQSLTQHNLVFFHQRRHPSIFRDFRRNQETLVRPLPFQTNR